MSKKLSEKQKLFRNYYINTFNATESAIKAGFSKKTAYAIGHNQLKKVEIKKYLKEISKPLLEELKFNRNEIIVTLTKIARGQVQDYEIKYDKQGNLKFKIVKDLVSNRLQALEILGKILGLFEEKPTQTFDKVVIKYTPVSYESSK